ncbi:MAG: radical SAM protein [Candidatus Omnitrophica bacterium]|nr:radical SAM protein [Candidatus Omnitrophota bacterium]
MIISWNITKECQLKCKHCYRDAGVKQKGELTTAEGLDLIEEIAKAGFKILIISGGEPLMRADVYDLIRHAKAQGIRPVLGSNGLLITREVARKLKEAGLVRAGISLDSISENVHDDFRQEQGAWKGTIAAMKICREEGLDFQIHTTVTTYNYKDVEKITDLAVELGAKAHHIFFLVPTGRGKDMDAVIPDDKYQELLQKIMKKQGEVSIELKPVCAPQFVPLAKDLGQSTRFQKGCLAGTSYCVILPNGDVHPCPYFPVRVANVRDQKFSEMWKEHSLFKELREANYTGQCGACEHKMSCGGCRARAYAESGDYMDFDPACIYH